MTERGGRYDPARWHAVLTDELGWVFSDIECAIAAAHATDDDAYPDQWVIAVVTGAAVPVADGRFPRTPDYRLPDRYPPADYAHGFTGCADEADLRATWADARAIAEARNTRTAAVGAPL